MTSRIIVMCSESSKAQVMKNHAYNTVNIDEKEGAKTNKKVRKPSCHSKYQIDLKISSAVGERILEKFVP